MAGPKYGEFSFPSSAGFTRSSGESTTVRPHTRRLAKGGPVSDAAQDKKAVAAGVHKHERALHKGEPLTKLARGGKVAPKVPMGRSKGEC